MDNQPADESQKEVGNGSETLQNGSVQKPVSSEYHPNASEDLRKDIVTRSEIFPNDPLQSRETQNLPIGTTADDVGKVPNPSEAREGFAPARGTMSRRVVLSD